MAKISELKFTIKLNDNKIPESIQWEASDNPAQGRQACEALMISMWDKAAGNTLGIDLWTEKLLVNDMNLHVVQTLMKMADTVQRATRNQAAGNLLRSFARSYADKMIPKKNGK